MDDEESQLRAKRLAALNARNKIQVVSHDEVDVKVEPQDSSDSATIDESSSSEDEWSSDEEEPESEPESSNEPSSDEELERIPRQEIRREKAPTTQDAPIKSETLPEHQGESNSEIQVENNHCMCVKCGQIRIQKTAGMCVICYYTVTAEPNDQHCQCEGCGLQKLNYCSGKCISCFYGVKVTEIKKEQRFCKTCGTLLKSVNINEMCIHCYRQLSQPEKDEIRRQRRFCTSCKKRKKTRGFDMCRICHRRSTRDPLSNHRNCSVCGEFKKHYGHGMCRNCHNKTRKDKPRKKIGICITCNFEKKIYSKGKCQNCTQKLLRQFGKQVKCSDCGETKPKYHSSKCISCYCKKRYNSKEWRAKKQQQCRECKQFKLCPARQMCWACYQQIFQTPKKLAKKRRQKATKMSTQPKIELSSDSESDWERPKDVSSGDEDFSLKEEVKSEPEQSPSTSTL